MAQTQFNHRGHAVVIDESAHAPKVSVDGEEVHVSQLGPGRYMNHLLAFTEFSTLEGLARAVINHSNQFHGRRDA